MDGDVDLVSTQVRLSCTPQADLAVLASFPASDRGRCMTEALANLADRLIVD